MSDQRFQRHPESFSAALPDGVAILHGPTGTYFGLNEVGGLIWRHLEAARTVGELADIVRQDHDVEADRARRDVLAILGSLEEAGLVGPA